MEEAAFRHHGMDVRYINCEVAPEKLGDAVRGARAMGWAGFNCSIPHKVAVIEHLDGLGESARIMGAVNCAVRRGDQFIGENTDGKGFLKSLMEVVDPAGKRVVMFGAGGAARAIAVELALGGRRAITVVNRGTERGQGLVDLLNGKTKTKADLVVWEGDYKVPEGTDIVVNATSIGLYPDLEARLALDVSTLRPGMVVADVIANPPKHAAHPRRRGARLQGDRRPRHAGQPGRHRHQVLDRRRRRPGRDAARTDADLRGVGAGAYESSAA